MQSPKRWPARLLVRLFEQVLKQVTGRAIARVNQ